MVQAISNTLIQGLQLARRNYITTTAAIVGLAGVIVASWKHLEHRKFRGIETGANAIRDELEKLNIALDGWKGTENLAQVLFDHVRVGPSSAEVRNANKHPAFQDAARALRTLEKKSTEFNACPAQFLSEKKEAALTWLSEAAEAHETAWAALRLADGVNGNALAHQTAYGRAIEAAKAAIGADDAAIAAVHTQMALVKTARGLAALEENAALIGLADGALAGQFLEAGKIQNGAGADEQYFDDVKREIEKLADMAAFTVGVDATDFQANVHITQDAINRAAELKGVNGRGLWEGAALLTGFAALILALNHFLPIALGQQHRMIQVLRLPS